MTETKMTRRVLPISLLALLLGALGGCDVDSFMDPSNIGRHEATPVVLPILERLDVIDEPIEEIAGLGDIGSEDLIPDVSEYIIGPGDLVTITVFELITPGVDSSFTRRVSELGFVNLPIIQEVKAAGLTAKLLEDKIKGILDPDILRDPIVTVVVQEGRQKTFSIFGTAQSGPFTIVKNNFRLLDAIALGGGIPPNVERIYVIRQVPLSPKVTEGDAGSGPAQKKEGAKPGAPKDPAKVLEELSKEPKAAPPPEPPKPLAEAVENPPTAPEGQGKYVNVNGKWVLVKDKAVAGAATAGGEATGGRAKPKATTEAPSSLNELVTQRVLEIDAQSLMRGEAKYNVVIRPNDIVRVPTADTGFVFISGAISRAGAYNLVGKRSLTLTQLIASAGDLEPVAIPERVDLYRRIGTDQQAIIRLNLRAIEEGVQPDLFLKPHDRVRVGTNVFAQFLAVIRNSFRMSYGFGFLLDRNFGNDVFGPPPTNLLGG